MVRLDGSDGCFSLDSPRSIEACRRRGLEDSDLEERSQEYFSRHEQPQQRPRRPSKPHQRVTWRGQSIDGHRYADITAVIRKERHEINRHRLLREVKRERSALVQGEKNKTESINRESTAPQTPHRFPAVATAPVSPYSPPRKAADSPFARGGDNSSMVFTTVASFAVGSDHRHHGGDGASRSRRIPRLSAGGEIGNPVLEGEAQRLEALKRRRFMELQQMLSYQLRSLAREERDRVMAEKARAREATAEAIKSKMLEDADQARINRERSGQEREKECAREAAVKRARQQEAARRLKAQDDLRQRQAEVAAERRAEQASQKAALLQARIDRGVRVRRAQQLRNERLAAQKANEKEAAAGAARRARESENKAKKAAAAERWATTRAAAEEARRRRDGDADAMREAAGGRMTELEGRAASFRSRQKEVAARERELREEEAAALTRERQETARRAVEREVKRKADVAEAKILRERQIALAREVRKEREATERRAEGLRKEELRKAIVERRAKAEEERREMTRRKLEEGAAKVELLLSKKERIQATRGKLYSETAKERKHLKGHFDALKDQSSQGGNIGYGKLVAALSAAATAGGGDSGPASPTTRRSNSSTPRLGSPRAARRAGKPIFRDVLAPSPSSRGFSCEQDAGAGDRTPRPPPAVSPRSNLSEASTASSLFLRRGGGGGIGRESSRTAGGTEAPKGKTPRKFKGAPSSGCSLSGSAAELRKRYRCDNRGGIAAGSRAMKQAIISPRNRKKRGQKQPRAAEGGGDGDGERGAPAASGGEQATRSTATGENNQEAVPAVSCDDADDARDEDEVLTAALAQLSSSTTAADTPASPPPPPAISDDAALLRGRYDRELLAILEQEQAAESAREKTLAAAKARAKAAQARANFSGTDSSTSKRRRRSDNNKSSPSAAAGRAPAAVAGHGRVVDLQQRREEEAEVAAREEVRLTRELARERKEASERVMRVSEEYEKALEKLSSGNTELLSAFAEEPGAG